MRHIGKSACAARGRHRLPTLDQMALLCREDDYAGVRRGLSLGKSGRVADDWLPLIVSGAWLTTMNAWSEPALLTAARQRRSRSGRWPARLCALAAEAPGVLWKGPGRTDADARMAMALRPR